MSFWNSFIPEEERYKFYIFTAEGNGVWCPVVNWHCRWVMDSICIKSCGASSSITNYVKLVKVSIQFIV